MTENEFQKKKKILLFYSMIPIARKNENKIFYFPGIFLAIDVGFVYGIHQVIMILLIDYNRFFLLNFGIRSDFF